MTMIEVAGSPGVAQTSDGIRERGSLDSFRELAASAVGLLEAVRNPLAYALLGTTNGPEADRLQAIYRTMDVEHWLHAARQVHAGEHIQG